MSPPLVLGGSRVVMGDFDEWVFTWGIVLLSLLITVATYLTETT